jgi:uncharacterized protein (DUF2141 family)
MDFHLQQVFRMGLLLGLLSFGRSVAWAESANNVILELEGLSDVSGEVFIAVYDSSEDWLTESTMLEEKVTIADARDGDLVRAALQLPPGEYALTIFFDHNGNGKLDTNFIGIPKEPMALSNNAKAKYGPPKYEDAVFSLAGEPVIQRLTVEKL